MNAAHLNRSAGPRFGAAAWLCGSRWIIVIIEYIPPCIPQLFTTLSKTCSELWEQQASPSQTPDREDYQRHLGSCWPSNDPNQKGNSHQHKHRACCSTNSQ